MFRKFSSVGGAAVIGMGLVIAITGQAPTPAPQTVDIELSATVLAMGGLGYETIDENLMKRVLAGRFANEDALVGLPWPGELTPFNGTLTLGQSVAVGLENMDAAIRSTPGPKIVVGASGTTLVVNQEMLRLAADPDAPPANELSFVVLGDADRGAFKGLRGIALPIFEYTVPAIPETKYDVMVVAGEYDGIGDWPDRWWNPLAVFNALAGTGLLQQIITESIVDDLQLEAFGSVHYDTMFADLSTVPARNITTTVNGAGGVTTTYLVPALDLPMLRPLKNLGVQQDVIDNLERVLRPIIDSAYVRNDPVGTGPARPRPQLRTGTVKPAAASSRAAERKTTGQAATRQIRSSRS
jgi:hypothetical protein